MKRALFSIAAAALVCGSIGSPSVAAPMGPVLAPLAGTISNSIPVYYYSGVYYPYRYNHRYYRYHHNHHYYKHRYYSNGRYHYY